VCDGLVVEVRGCEKIPVIGYRHGGHASPRGFLRQLADFAGPVQQGIIGVQVQVYEVC